MTKANANVPAREEEEIEIKIIKHLQEIQNEHNVDLYINVRLGLLSAFRAKRRVTK